MKHLKNLLLIAGVCLIFAPVTTYALTGYVYSVTVKGRVVGTYGSIFTQTGTMVLFNPITRVGTRNGVNNLDVALKVGNTFGVIPPAGSLNFTSNSKLSPLFGYSKNGAFAVSALDLTYTSWASNCLTFQPDPVLSAALWKNSPNIFVASSSLISHPFYTQRGGMRLCTKDGLRTFYGVINLQGTSFFQSFSSSTYYQATVAARLLKTYNFNL